jgi:hypothetical protein
VTTEELRMRDLHEDVRRAERQLATALGRDPDGPLGALRYLVPEAVARLRAATGAACAVLPDPESSGVVADDEAA